MNELIVPPLGAQLPSMAVKKIDDFLKAFKPYELDKNGKLCLFLDEKSGAHYLTCHLTGRILANSCDTEASLDGDEEDEIYKLNREITEDQLAYLHMETDAINGRTFEDIVLEYDTTYRPKKPLKVYGGQHRLRAVLAQPEMER